MGGDLWHAALLLSAWLMTYPEVVRGLRVLELGSGLGLCGIVAGYLARSVTLTGQSSGTVLSHSVHGQRSSISDCIDLFALGQRNRMILCCRIFLEPLFLWGRPLDAMLKGA